MVLLDNGKILMWDGGPDCLGAQSPTVWDPAAGTFTPVPLETQPELRDIFCSAQTVLADGRVLVAGGHDCIGPAIGTAVANVFDPATNQWTFGPDMAYRRWYPTATTLPDGRALVTAGSANNTLDYDADPRSLRPGGQHLDQAHGRQPDDPQLRVRLRAAGLATCWQPAPTRPRWPPTS